MSKIFCNSIHRRARSSIVPLKQHIVRYCAYGYNTRIYKERLIKKLFNKLGFTLIELMVVVLVVTGLALLIFFTFRDIQTKNRDEKRQRDLKALHTQIETFHVQNGRYPTLAQINNPEFRSKNFKGFEENTMKDPLWKSGGSCSTAKIDGKPILLGNTNSPNCYAYVVSPKDCDNEKVDCTNYVLKIRLEVKVDDEEFIERTSVYK